MVCKLHLNKNVKKEKINVSRLMYYSINVLIYYIHCMLTPPPSGQSLTPNSASPISAHYISNLASHDYI